jgi:hypothetical protein
MSWKIIVPLLIGAGLGALLGSTRTCASGGCPLTATPWRGALYGAFIGLLFGLSLATAPPAKDTDDTGQKEVLTPAGDEATMSHEEIIEAAGRDADRPHS